MTLTFDHFPLNLVVRRYNDLSESQFYECLFFVFKLEATTGKA